MSAPAPAPVVHFYSPVTGISIELPRGFERIADDESSATYALSPDDPEHPAAADGSSGSRPGTATLHIQVVGHLEAGADDEQRRAAAAAVADGFAEHGELIRPRRSLTLDSEPVESLVVDHPEQGRLYVAAVAGSSRLLTLVGSGTEDLALWDAAVETIRVIEL